MNEIRKCGWCCVEKDNKCLLDIHIFGGPQPHAPGGTLIICFDCMKKNNIEDGFSIVGGDNDKTVKP